jgi:alpha-mannosidase
MLKTIYLFHHSHTDIGYTHPQPTVRHLHVRHIDDALRQIEATADLPPDARMHWTCETLLPVFDWWNQATMGEKETFLRLEKAGLIEVTGMWSIGTQCSPPSAWEWMMKQVERARSEMGVNIRSAMLSDINGTPWSTPDYLSAHGIKNFLMGINAYFGKSNMPRLYPFQWRGAKGGLVHAFNGFHYNNNQYFGIPYSIDESIKGIARLEEYLKNRGDFDMDFAVFQATRPDFNDNNGPDPQLPQFVAEWNARGLQPAMKLTTLSGFFDSVGSQFFHSRPELSGEWTDFWNIGASSTPYETALNRETYRNLETTEAFLPAIKENSEILTMVEEAMENAVNYDEHTWGSDYPVVAPHCYATRAGRHFKNDFAFRAHDAALRARAETLMGMLRNSGRMDNSPHVLVANPHAWKATKEVEVPAIMLVEDVCPTNAHFHRLQYSPLTLPPVSTPQAPLPLPDGVEVSDTLHFGVELSPHEVRILSREDVFAIGKPLRPFEKTVCLDLGRIENESFQIRLDPQTGGLASWVCRHTGRGFLEPGMHANGVPLSEQPRSGTREEMYAWPEWTKFLAPKGFIPSWESVRQAAVPVGDCKVTTATGRHTLTVDFNHPLCRKLSVAWTLKDGSRSLEVEVKVDFQRDTAPTSWYWPLQFAVESPVFDYDSCGSAVRMGRDQLPDSNMDFFTVHRWVRVGLGDSSMLVLPLDTPLVMMGGLNFARSTTIDTPREPFFAGVLHSNYWITNYAPSCDGEVTFRFVLIPGSEVPGVDDANRLAAEAEQKAVVAPFVPSQWPSV